MICDNCKKKDYCNIKLSGNAAGLSYCSMKDEKDKSPVANNYASGVSTLDNWYSLYNEAMSRLKDKAVYVKSSTIPSKSKSSKPNRDTIISKDDILNLKIAIETMDFKTFLELT